MYTLLVYFLVLNSPWGGGLLVGPIFEVGLVLSGLFFGIGVTLFVLKGQFDQQYESFLEGLRSEQRLTLYRDLGDRLTSAFLALTDMRDLFLKTRALMMFRYGEADDFEELRTELRAASEVTVETLRDLRFSLLRYERMSSVPKQFNELFNRAERAISSTVELIFQQIDRVPDGSQASRNRLMENAAHSAQTGAQSSNDFLQEILQVEDDLQDALLPHQPWTPRLEGLDSLEDLTQRVVGHTLGHIKQSLREGSVSAEYLGQALPELWSRHSDLALQLIFATEVPPGREFLLPLCSAHEREGVQDSYLRTLYTRLTQIRTDPEYLLEVFEVLWSEWGDQKYLLYWIKACLDSDVAIIDMAQGKRIVSPAEADDLEGKLELLGGDVGDTPRIRCLATTPRTSAGSQALFDVEVSNPLSFDLETVEVHFGVEGAVARKLRIEDAILKPSHGLIRTFIEEDTIVLRISKLPPTEGYTPIMLLSIPTLSTPGDVTLNAVLLVGPERRVLGKESASVNTRSSVSLGMDHVAGFIDPGGVFQSSKSIFKVGHTGDAFATHTIVTNQSDYPATGVAVKFSVSPTMSVATLEQPRSGFPTKGRVEGANDESLLWNIGSLAPAESAEIQLILKAVAPGSDICRASLSADQIFGNRVQEADLLIEEE